MLEPQQHAGASPQVDVEEGSLALPYADDGGIDLFGDDGLDEIEARKAPWWRRRSVIVTFCVVLLAAIVVGVLAYRNAQPKPIIYQTANVASGTLNVTVSATGPIQATTYGATFSGTGKLAEIDVKIGDHVTAGQQLAKLDTTALQDALRQAQASSYQAYDQEQNAIFACNNQKSPPPFCIQAAEDAYGASQAQLQTAKNNLANAVLTAPHAGVVTAINGAVGGAPGTGSSSTGSATASSASGFIIIQDISSLQVQASVNETDISNLVIGQPAAFTVAAYGSRPFTGKVSLISPAGQSSSNVVTYPVTIDVDMASVQRANILPGMTATVTITRAQRTNALLLPATAITFARSAANPANGGVLTQAQVREALIQGRQMLATYEQQNPTYEADSPTVAYVLERQGTGQKATWSVKPVVLGLTNGSAYQVLAGLTKGETVVTGQTGGSSTGATTTSGTTNPFGGGGGGGRNPFGGGGGAGGAGGAGGTGGAGGAGR